MDNDKIDELLGALDAHARDVDYYEYGLPVHSERIEPLRQIVRDWLDRNVPEPPRE